MLRDDTSECSARRNKKVSMILFTHMSSIAAPTLLYVFIVLQSSKPDMSK